MEQQAPTAPAMSILLLALMIFFGGFLGGVIDFLHKINYREARFLFFEETADHKTFWLLLFRRRRLPQIIYAGEFASHVTEIPQNILYNFTLSLIAGFASRTLLPNIAGRLERQLEEQGQQIQATKNELAQTASDAHNQEAIFLGTLAFREGSIPSDREVGINALTRLLRDHPGDRRAAILLGRIYRGFDLSKAIQVLDAFVSAREKRPNPNDRDLADGLYNRACYKTLLAASLKKSGGDASAVAAHVAAALADLRRSVTITPSNRTDAAADIDFAFIKDEPDFRVIVSS